MSRIMKAQRSIEKGVVAGYRAIEDGVVSGYRKIEDSVVAGYKKIENKFVDTFLTPDETTSTTDSDNKN